MKSFLLTCWLACVAFAPLTAVAIDAADVRPYDEVFAVSAQATGREQVEVRWDIAPGYYLYNNQFLSFEVTTPGVVTGDPVLPQGKPEFDELLGQDVIKFHGRMSASLPLLQVPESVSRLDLKLRSQGCLEKVLCYPPTEQLLSVQLASAASPLAGFFEGALQELDQDALGKDPALPPDEAFQYEVIGLNAETLLVRFTAQPGYYLYVDKFDFRVLDAPGYVVREVTLPVGTTKDDPEFGPVAVIYDQVEIPVRLNRPAGPVRELVLEADYQGCRDGDICYPPQTSKVSLQLAASERAIDQHVMSAAAPAASAPPVSEQSRLARLLVSNPAGALLAFFVAGLLLAITPCVFPMVPILSGIIAGEGDGITTRRAFWLSLVYVLAMAATYTVAGVLAGLFGKNLQAMFQNPWVISAFAALFVLLALSMFGLFELQLPHRFQTAVHAYSRQHRGGKLGGVAILGVLSALIVGPCVAPPLAAALIVIGDSGNPLLGGSALFSLSLGMGAPLILFGVLEGKYLPRAGAWMETVKAVFGVGLLALAIWMLERIIQGPVILALWGLLAIGCGVFLRALDRLPEQASPGRRLARVLGLVLLLVGAAELVGALSGGKDWLRPLQQLTSASGPSASHVRFQRVKSSAELHQAVSQAATAGKPTMLDFYADWCVECIRMERNTFPDADVQGLLAQMQPLQADVTAHDETDQALMAEFRVIGPPAILFFDRSGSELEAHRLVGYFTPEEFADHLRKVLAQP
jgi:thiol:disulfide interchange protein DsbD